MKRHDYSDLVGPGVAGLVPYTPGQPIETLERNLGIVDAIKLASNENPLGASPKARAALDEHLTKLHFYPDADGFELKKRLAEKHAVLRECITLGNGSNELLVFLAQVFLGPDTSAVFSQYAFAVYPIVTQMMGARAQVVPAHAHDHPMALGHDLRAMYAAIEPSTRLVFVANPNNPTGTWLHHDRLRDFVASLPPEVICVVDEAYTEYGEPDVLGDAATWVDSCPNLVVTRTFSKAYGLAGLRVGYAISNPGIADLLNRVRPTFNVNALGLAAARAALDDQAFLKQTKATNEAGLAQLTSGLDQLGVAHTPSKANFVLIHFDQPAHSLSDQLSHHGVIVRPVANYGLPNALRVSVGTPEQNTRFLNALADALS